MVSFLPVWLYSSLALSLSSKFASSFLLLSPRKNIVLPSNSIQHEYNHRDVSKHEWKSSSRLFASTSTSTTEAFDKACTAFEAAHMEDPRMIEIKGETLPYSVHYHRRMAYWLDEITKGEDEVDAPEVVKLAVRCQHIRRWTRPRTDYPDGLQGYKKWRTDLQKFHTQQATEILLDCGYDETTTKRLGEILQKKDLQNDPDVQLLEDVIGIVFLENEYDKFIEENEDKYNDDKLVDIVQKTWKKMTPRGHAVALQLAGSLTEHGLQIVERALAT